MRAFLVLVMSASAANATPLEKLWEIKVPCDNPQIVDWHDALAWMDDHGRVQRVARATGKLAKPLVLAKIPQAKGPALGWESHARIEGIVGDDLVIHHGHEFAIVDGKTGKLRWRAEQPNSDGGLPRLVVADNDVFWIHPAHLGKGDPPVFVERLALATGKPTWRGDMPPDSGQILWAQADAGRLYVVTNPDFIGPTIHAAAFDLATGKRLWAQPMTSKKPSGKTTAAPGNFVADGGKLYYLMPGEGLDILEGANGKRVARLPLSTIPDGARSLAIIGTRAYVANGSEVTALDLSARTIAWTIKREETYLVHATPTALYLTDGDVATAHALADGSTLASWGVFESDIVYAGTNTPAFITCDRDNKRLVAFDPSGAVTPVVHAVVTGRLVCGTCKTHLFPPLTVTLGEATAKTDNHGNFKLTVDARGSRMLSFDLPPVDSPVSWEGDTRRAIHFTQKTKYALGNLRIVLDCGPLEDC